MAKSQISLSRICMYTLQFDLIGFLKDSDELLMMISLLVRIDFIDIGFMPDTAG